MSLIRQVRNGKENNSQFYARMRGSGPFADLIARRFEVAIRKYGLDRQPVELDVTKFRKVHNGCVQPSLFD